MSPADVAVHAVLSEMSEDDLKVTATLEALISAALAAVSGGSTVVANAHPGERRGHLARGIRQGGVAGGSRGGVLVVAAARRVARASVCRLHLRQRLLPRALRAGEPVAQGAGRAAEGS